MVSEFGLVGAHGDGVNGYCARFSGAPMRKSIDLLHCLECKWMVLRSTLVGIIVISVYPYSPIQRSLTLGELCKSATYPKDAGEVDLKDDLLVTSREQKWCQDRTCDDGAVKTYIEKPRRMCSRCMLKIRILVRSSSTFV